MKKAYAKIMLVLLAVCLVTGAVAMSVHADTPKTINDQMLVWWNFEGADPLADKATADGVTSNLSAVGGTVEPANGTVVVSEVSGTSLKTFDFTQFTDLTEMTVYVRLKITAKQESFEQFFYTTSEVGGGKLRMMTSNTVDFIRATCGHNPRVDALVFDKDDAGVWNNGQWITVALVYNGDGVHNLTTLYVSADGENYHLALTDPNGSPKTMGQILGANAVDIILGQYNPDAATATFEYDDVRIYNKALTDKEVKSIIPNSLELKEQATETTTEGTPTEAPTMPALTEAPNGGVDAQTTTAAKATTTAAKAAATTAAPAEESGCGSMLAISAPALTLAACGILLRKKKKQDE